MSQQPVPNEKPAWWTANDPESYQRRIRAGFYPDEWFPISHSGLTTYEDCPRRHFYQVVEKRGRESGDAADMGTALHEVQEVIAAYGLDHAYAFMSAMIPMVKNKKYYRLRKSVLEKILLHKDYLLSSEERYHWEFPVLRERDGKILKVQFEAKIDLLFYNPFENWMEIVDGKSSEDVMPTVDDDPQGNTYAVVADHDVRLAALAPISEVIFTQAQWAKGGTVSTIISPEQRKEWEDLLTEKIKRMVNDTEYKPKTGVHCQWCPFIMLCDAGKKKLPEFFNIPNGEPLPIIIKSFDDLTRIAEAIAHYKAQISRYEKAMAGYLRFAQQSEDAPLRIPIPGGVWQFEVQDYRQPDGGIEGLLRRHPEEKDGLKGSYFSRLVLKRK